jgi:hypothetical protein
MNTIHVTETQLDAATAVMADAIRVGERGTRGDNTEIGLLAHVLEALDVRVVLPPVRVPFCTNCGLDMPKAVEEVCGASTDGRHVWADA